MKYLSFILSVLASLTIGFICGKSRHGNSPKDIVFSTADTLVVRDTVVHYKPLPVEIRRTDTISVAVMDTLVIHDTTFVMLPMETRIYKDSSYMAVVSGYCPSLDSICIYPQTRHITYTHTVSAPPAKRWGIGVQAGYGLSIAGGKAVPTPYIGVGLSYNIIRF